MTIIQGNVCYRDLYDRFLIDAKRHSNSVEIIIDEGLLCVDGFRVPIELIPGPFDEILAEHSLIDLSNMWLFYVEKTDVARRDSGIRDNDNITLRYRISKKPFRSHGTIMTSVDIVIQTLDGRQSGICMNDVRSYIFDRDWYTH